MTNNISRMEETKMTNKKLCMARCKEDGGLLGYVIRIEDKEDYCLMESVESPLYWHCQEFRIY